MMKVLKKIRKNGVRNNLYDGEKIEVKKMALFIRIREMFGESPSMLICINIR